MASATPLPFGLARTYQDLFGDPWADLVTILPGSLQQPALRFPFQPGRVWAYTGGPHTGSGTGEPFAAIDFAPGSDKTGCVNVPVDEYATAMADGLVVRSDIDGTVIDLDKVLLKKKNPYWRDWIRHGDQAKFWDKANFLDKLQGNENPGLSPVRLV